MPSAGSSIARQASKLSHEYSADRTSSAGRGAILSSQNWRSAARSSRCSSVTTPAVWLRPGGGTRARQVVEQQAVVVVGRRLGDPVAHAVEHLEPVRPLDVL